MNHEQKNRVIVVLGMHRSGTSVITRSLRLLGVGLGDNLHPAGFDNPKGFWEDRECLRINEQMLGHLGSAFDRLDLSWDCTKDDPVINNLKIEAQNLIIRKLSENDGLWGFKDPRTCRLLSFWRNVLGKVGCKVNYIIVLRNPLSVAASLATRNCMPSEKSYFLWLQHMLPAVIDSAGAPRLVVSYDQLMEAPLKQVDRISAHFRLPMADLDGSLVSEFRNDFLDDGLRHTKFSSKDVELDNNVPPDVVKGYQLLLRASRDEISLDSPELSIGYKKLYDRLKAFAPAFSYANALEDERESIYKTVAEHYGQIVSLNQAVVERDGQIVSLNQAVVERNGQIASLNQAVASLNRQLNEIYESKSWLLTKPFRYIRRQLLTPTYVSFRRNLSAGTRWAWRRLPISIQGKQKILNVVFKGCPFIFGWTEVYRSWKSLSFPIPAAKHIPLLMGKPLTHKPAKLICFYLPQFHSIPENDAWWGDGFTEWTNVRPAQPQFKGHYQPRKPGELGYYNLLDPKVQKRQIELAKLYGIEGFCFYLYWFDGKRLLGAPIENYLKDRSFDLPFCLCWANENWSRRWDGMDSEILITQKHSPEDDLAFIAHVARYMRDPRYIRIDGRPLLIVYRPSLLPSAKETAKRWRAWCKNEGIGDIYLAYTQSFEIVNPDIYGFDAAIEFPPNNSAPPNITGCVEPHGKDFSCTIYDWRVFVERSENYKQPTYKLFRGVCPSWDNTARRKNHGTVFVNNSPALYQRWLENTIHDTKQQHAHHNERLIFINAWNEWAEGAYLEPDEQYGYAWLQATRDALSNATSRQGRSILLVTHDCHPHGAQLLILETAKQLKMNGFKVSILALDGGKLIDDFAQVGHTLNAGHVGEIAMAEFLVMLRSEGNQDVITSTVVSGRVVVQLKKLGFQILSLIHELPGVIRDMKQEANAKVIAQYADKLVFPAELVYQRFCEIAQVPPEKAVIRPQGVLRKNPYKNRRSEAYHLICNKHNLPSDTQIVLGIGYLDARKGPDLFVEIASQVLELRPKTTFIWIGHAESGMALSVETLIDELGLKGKVLFVGFEREPMAYYAAASVYALTSREDPFPNVVLESAEVGVPVVAFKGVSGASDFIVEQGGHLAAYLDTHDFALQVCKLLGKPSEKACNRVESLQQYALDLLHHLNGFPRVSVVVPNYNYERHIIERLDSIYCQKFPVYEVIVLDDASSDNSVKIIEDYLERTGNEAGLFINGSNTGSVFLQWQKGTSLCKGDVLWIAEADDLSDRDFLSELCPAFQDTNLVLAYSQSKQIDGQGKEIALNYMDYTNDISECWMNNYERRGVEEIDQALVIKNTIPNVSAVVFRRKALEDALAELGDDLFNYRVAGDWLVYLHILKKGNIYYCKKSLNLHRRHKKSITGTTQKLKHLEEVLNAQAFARSLSTPSKEALAKADAYIRLLHEYFGIPHNKFRDQQDV